MKIREIIYFLDQANFCFTVIKSLIKRWLRHIKNKSLNASTYNIDKRGPLQKKAVEVIKCNLCPYYDYYYDECMNNNECDINEIEERYIEYLTAGEMSVSHDAEAATQDHMMTGGLTTSRD